MPATAQAASGPDVSPRRVGILELKAHLSRVVQQAANGQRFEVTDHGAVVAELGPVRSPDRPGEPATDVRDRLVAAGGTAESRPFDLESPLRTAGWQPVDVAALMNELRGER